MTDEKIVNKLREIGYEPFQYDAEPDELNGYNKYCVYYPHSLRKQDKHVLHQIVEFVFVNETEDFDEVAIIDALEEIGLFFSDGDYGRLKKVAGGDIVNSLNLRFARPKRRKCVYQLMETIFKLKDDDLQKLVDSIMKIPDLAESIMNDYLHNQGANIVIDKITERMPVGVNNNKKYKGYPRTHAKYSLSLTFTKMNLGFAIKTSQSPFFGYLYFPAFGEGTSKYNAPNLFFEEGAESAREPIVDELAKLLEEKIKEGLSNGK